MWLNDELINKKFDLIIDDGPHTFSSNFLFFSTSYEKLKVGGIYIIEDINLDFIDNLYDSINKFLNENLLTADLEKLIMPWPPGFNHPSPVILKMNNLIVIKKLN
jgi:hypothetical protein